MYIYMIASRLVDDGKYMHRVFAMPIFVFGGVDSARVRSDASTCHSPGFCSLSMFVETVASALHVRV